jgi:hypothetical protein
LIATSLVKVTAITLIDGRPAITLVALCGETYPKKDRLSRIRGSLRKVGKGSRASQART